MLQKQIVESKMQNTPSENKVPIKNTFSFSIFLALIIGIFITVITWVEEYSATESFNPNEKGNGFSNYHGWPFAWFSRDLGDNTWSIHYLKFLFDVIIFGVVFLLVKFLINYIIKTIGNSKKQR
jgi:Na+-driven multidrug efflux pump